MLPLLEFNVVPDPKVKLPLVDPLEFPVVIVNALVAEADPDVCKVVAAPENILETDEMVSDWPLCGEIVMAPDASTAKRFTLF
jgi:hypothetical protein